MDLNQREILRFLDSHKQKNNTNKFWGHWEHNEYIFEFYNTISQEMAYTFKKLFK